MNNGRPDSKRAAIHFLLAENPNMMPKEICSQAKKRWRMEIDNNRASVEKTSWKKQNLQQKQNLGPHRIPQHLLGGVPACITSPDVPPVYDTITIAGIA